MTQEFVFYTNRNKGQPNIVRWNTRNDVATGPIEAPPGFTPIEKGHVTLANTLVSVREGAFLGPELGNFTDLRDLVKNPPKMTDGVITWNGYHLFCKGAYILGCMITEQSSVISESEKSQTWYGKMLHVHLSNTKQGHQIRCHSWLREDECNDYPVLKQRLISASNLEDFLVVSNKINTLLEQKYMWKKITDEALATQVAKRQKTHD